MLMAGSPDWLRERLMPWIPSEVAELWTQSEGTVYGLVREYPTMSSLTRCSEKMWVSFSASPDAFRSVFWPPETKGPKSNLAAAAGGVGMQQPPSSTWDQIGR